MSAREDTLDYHKYYDLDSYLFETVGSAFHRDGYLSAFDFFCIVIWKANRAKSRMAKKVLAGELASFDAAVRELTRGIAERPVPRDKLCYLIGKWGLWLPMASAVLAVINRDEFTA
jgi:hypothetical protein